MITNISWIDYLTLMLPLLVIYYLFIGFRFYFKDLKNFVSSGKQILPLGHGRKTQTSENTNFLQHAHPMDEDDEGAYGLDMTEVTALEVEHLIVKLKEIVAKSSLYNLSEKEFKEDVKSVLCRYPEIKASAFHKAVNELIISECEKYGSIRLREDEVVMLWDDV